MKKLTIILFALLAGMAAFAEDVEMGETEDYKEEKVPPMKAPYLKPTVSYEDAVFTISSRFTLNDAYVLIKDEDGNTIFTEFIGVLTGSYTFTVTENVAANKYSIELIYTGHHLIGYF